jgi:hypothetical protein
MSGASGRHTTKLKQSILLRCLCISHRQIPMDKVDKKYKGETDLEENFDFFSLKILVVSFKIKIMKNCVLELFKSAFKLLGWHS